MFLALEYKVFMWAFKGIHSHSGDWFTWDLVFIFLPLGILGCLLTL